jgi:hypothetical protein
MATTASLEMWLDRALREFEELRWRVRELERRLAEASQPGQPNPGQTAARPVPTQLEPEKINRQQRREAERLQRRSDMQQRRRAPPP